MHILSTTELTASQRIVAGEMALDVFIDLGIPPSRADSVMQNLEEARYIRAEREGIEKESESG